MNSIDKIREMLSRGDSVYMKDDFYDTAIRIDAYFNCTCFIKSRGGAEGIVDKSNNTFCQIELGGEFISKEEYERY